MSDASIIRATDHRRMRWTNGGGWTTELVAFPSPEAWDWRLSVAEVAADGPFSVFTGIDRTIALLSGRGFALTIHGTPELVADEPFRPHQFDGAANTYCRLIDGPIEDVNLMVRRGTLRLGMTFIVLHPGAPTVIKSPTVLVVDGEIAHGTDRLRRLDVLGFIDGSEVRSPDDATVLSAAAGRPAVIALISPSQR